MSPPTTSGLSLDNLSPTCTHENETVSISANQDDLLDKRMFQASFSKNKDSAVKKFHVSIVTGASFDHMPHEMRKIYSNDEVKE